jgi:hypothetical protein
MPAWIRPMTLPISQRPMTQKAMAATHLDGQLRHRGAEELLN